MKFDFHGQNASAGFLEHLHAAFAGGNDAERGQQKPRANYGMTGERELLGGGKNSQAREGAVAGGALHENRFGEIHFAGDGLHALGSQAVTVGDDGERIAGVGLIGKDVERVESPFQDFSREPAQGDDAGGRWLFCNCDGAIWIFLQSAHKCGSFLENASCSFGRCGFGVQPEHGLGA